MKVSTPSRCLLLTLVPCRRFLRTLGPPGGRGAGAARGGRRVLMRLGWIKVLEHGVLEHGGGGSSLAPCQGASRRASPSSSLARFRSTLPRFPCYSKHAFAARGWAPRMNPSAPVRMGPSAPVRMGPSAPVRMGPSAPVRMGPSAPVRMGPSAPVRMGPPSSRARPGSRGIGARPGPPARPGLPLRAWPWGGPASRNRTQMKMLR